MAVRDWYDSLFVKAYPPAAQAAKGFALAKGLPTSSEGAKHLLATALGTMFGLPDVYSEVGQGIGQTLEDTASMVTHPAETAGAIYQTAKRNPAATAGFLMGMALPPGGGGPKDPDFLNNLGEVRNITRQHVRMIRGIPESEFLPTGGAEYAAAMKFGRRALRDAELAPERRVMRERARVHAGLEGPAGPSLGMPKVGTTDSPIDIILGMPSLTLQRIHQDYLKDSPGMAKVIEQELTRRGLKPDISDIQHQLYEGPGKPLRMGYKEPELWGPQGEPRIWTREERGQQMLNEAGLGDFAQQNLDPKTAGLAGVHLQAAKWLTKMLPDAPPGTAVAFYGERWVNTKRGWSRVGNKPLAKDYDWIFKQTFDKDVSGEVDAASLSKDELGNLLDSMYAREDDLGGVMEPGARSGPPRIESNINRAVDMVKAHGGFEDEAQARTIVAKKISDRMKSGQATTQEIVWFNMHRGGMFNPGGFKWQRD